MIQILVLLFITYVTEERVSKLSESQSAYLHKRNEKHFVGMIKWDLQEEHSCIS